MLCFQLSFENADDFDSLAVLIRKIMSIEPPLCGNGGAERIERVW